MYSFILTGKSSELSFDFNPNIFLDEDLNYEIGLTNFDSFYSIPNVDETNNVFAWFEKNEFFKVAIPIGSYELNTLIDVLQKEILKEDQTALISFSFDVNTATVTLTTNRKISFNIENSIGSVLGFKKDIEADTVVKGDAPVEILKINAICVDCNIASGSYLNGEPVHIIYSFFPTVSPGYKIIESPQTVIYYPVIIKQLKNITLRIIDQDGKLINFRGENITVRLHLKKVD